MSNIESSNENATETNIPYGVRVRVPYDAVRTGVRARRFDVLSGDPSWR